MLLAFLVIVALALAGCGGDDGKTTGTGTPEAAAPEQLDDAFIAKVEAVCEEENAAFDALGDFPFTDFDPLNPDKKMLLKVGAYFKPTVATRRHVKAALPALGEPERGQKAWDALRARAIENQDNAIAQVQAALRSDRKTFVKTVREAERLTTDLKLDLIPAAGFDATSPCAPGI
jgi:hypothetical protein